MFRLIAIDFSLLSPTSPCELSEREVTSPSNLKVVGALDNYSLVFVIFINFFGQLSVCFKYISKITCGCFPSSTRKFT